MAFSPRFTPVHPPSAVGALWGIVEESALTGASTLPLRCGYLIARKSSRFSPASALVARRRLRSAHFPYIAAALWCCIAAAHSHRPLASAVASHPCARRIALCGPSSSNRSPVRPLLQYFPPSRRSLLLSPQSCRVVSCSCLFVASVLLFTCNPSFRLRSGTYGSLSSKRPSHVIPDHQRNPPLASIAIGLVVGHCLARFKRSSKDSACLSPTPRSGTRGK